MVRAAMLSLLLSTQASQSTRGACAGGSCDVGRESSVLMQRKSRRGGVQTRQAQQAMALNSPVDLFQATAQLLRVGANPDVIQFTNDTLEALETEIIPSLLGGYDQDSALLNESLQRVERVLASFEHSKAALHPLREAEAKAIDAHKSCRQREQQACHDHKTCVEECSTLNTTYIHWETEYLAVTETVHHRWCESVGNKSDPVWRTSMATRFEKYVEYGTKRIEAHQALTTCVTHCETQSWSHTAHGLLQEASILGGAKKADEEPFCCAAHTAECLACTAKKTIEQYCAEHPTTSGCEEVSPEPFPIDGGWHPDACELAEGNPCDCMQRAMETASCTAEEAREQANSDLDMEWRIASSTFEDMVAAAKKREEDRHRGFKALKGIKCLLKHIVDRAGKPCDEADEPGEADGIVEECETFWQIEVHDLLMPWNLTYPELPSKPQHLPVEPHPCTDAWVAAEYGWLAGECFAAVPACQACPVVVADAHEDNFWSEGPEGLVQVESTEELVQDRVQGLLQVRADADGETRRDTDGDVAVGTV